MITPDWQALAPNFRLSAGLAHVVKISLDANTQQIDKAYALLSKDQQARADRFKFPIHRARYIMAHAYLRSLLAKLTDTTPESLQFSYGPHGKPYIANCPVEFNLSHSDGLALCAFAEIPIGVDIEKLKSCEAFRLAERFFAPEEVAMLKAFPESEHITQFYHIWTLKEAVIKATGLGLTQALDSFAVGLPAALLRTNHHPGHAWHLVSLNLGQDYTGAVAALAPLNQIHYWLADNISFF